MKERTFTLTDPQNYQIHCYEWLPEEALSVKGVVQISHGMAESAIRYRRLAESLTDAGYAVYANDHRGHGFTARGEAEYGMIGEDGFQWMVHNMKQLKDTISELHPDKPVVLLGHSMGSFLTQLFMTIYGNSVNAAVLSGAIAPQPAWMLLPGILIAKGLSRIKGERHRSPLLHNLTLGRNNLAFRPARTKSDWLSRDPLEVDWYVANDPHHKVSFSAGFFRHFYEGLLNRHKKESLKGVPLDVPLYIFAGDRDPVGAFGKGVRQLAFVYRQIGMKDITVKLYPGARHETLNETNRDEVTSDLLDWMNARFSGL